MHEAFTLARREHGDQRRQSGELFFTHPLTVAYYLAEYRMDAPALAAALLHDVAEDTLVTISEIEAQFGQEVARLVDGVTKLKNVSAGVARDRKLSRQEIQDVSLHKLFDVMTSDVRTVIIKLFDRLHNMRTIQFLSPQKQRRKATETLAVYAPLANRLGIWRLKNELESLSLEVLHNQAYQTIKQRLADVTERHKAELGRIKRQIVSFLAQSGIEVQDVLLAPENAYTVYQDLITSGTAYKDIDETMRLVILLKDTPTCYLAMGRLHEMWKPVPGTFDDYIAVPRDNLYRSLHTTVVHSNGQRLKLRFRTMEMHKVSDIGVLARWRYADTPFWSEKIAARIESFLANISETIKLEPQDPAMGVKGVVEDMFGKQIRVYTPRGDGIELAKGATPIDFAYAIHTRLGDQCREAYVNEALYPLNRPLRDGDRVRIVRHFRAQPQRSWLDEDLGYIATNYARSHARRWFRRLPEETAIAQGKALLEFELEMLGLSDYPHEKIAAAFDREDTEALYHDLGRADILPTVVATRVLEDRWDEGPARDLDKVVYSAKGEKFIITNARDRRLRVCSNCEPRPRDPIVGFVRSDNGVTVHRQGCHSLRPERMAGRIIKLGWGEAGTRRARLVTIQVDVYDRSGLLFEITQLMQDQEINIAAIHTFTPRKGEVQLVLTLEVISPRQLVRVLHQVYAVANVFAVHCLQDTPVSSSNGDRGSFYLPE
ncbi:MAG: RelA/SpoT family protein [Anaerolineae bacterium]